MSLIVSAKCMEFRTRELVFPTRGEMMETMYFESWYEGDPVHETMSLRWTDSL